MPSSNTAAKPRFVVLRHCYENGQDQQDHFDLMLESDDGLLTWRLPTALETGVRQQTQRLDNHRIEYLDYEGPVSGSRGTVTRVDRGSYDPDQWTENRISVRLSGDRLIGILSLVRTQGEFWRVEFTEFTEFGGSQG